MGACGGKERGGGGGGSPKARKEDAAGAAAFRARVVAAAPAFPLPEGVRFGYGTAGFRTVGAHLPGVAFRMGLFSAMRGRKTGQAAGVVLSASHNAAPDNGFKLVDSSGAMLPQEWEKSAELVANAQSPEDIVAAMEKVATEFSVAAYGPAVVHIGRDTRETGPVLLAAFLKGIEAAGARAVDHGVVTTPQLHYCVWQTNVRGGQEVGVEDYLEGAAAAFSDLTGGGAIDAPVVIDCSNGVGAPQMATLRDRLKAKGLLRAEIELRNCDTAAAAGLNHLCGGDFVQKEKRAPTGFSAAEFGPQSHCVSYDGDADRLVYFYFDQQGEFALLDGDRIIVLYASLVAHLLQQTEGVEKPKVGVVQTAYANGASTRYIRGDLGLEVDCVPTGVKHLHHKALDYDIGIYFEANGHGTMLVSEAFQASLKKAGGAGAAKLLALSRLASPCCGDAMLDMLLAEAALKELGWSIPDWAAKYADAPSRMTKVTVPDPQRIKTVWDQTSTTAPDGLQAGIDAAVLPYNTEVPSSSRSFVRPSGTEPIVRVYAESDTQGRADELAKKVEDVVKGVLGKP